MKHFTFGILKQFTVAGAFVLGMVSFSSIGQTFDWATQIEGTDNDLATTTSADINGNVYSGGYFFTDIDLDPSAGTDVFTTSTANQDAFVTKVDQDGNYLWGFTLASDGRNRVNRLISDDAGNFYITGYFENEVNFDPNGTFNVTSSSDRDIFIAKYDTDANLIWVKQFESPGYSEGVSLTLSYFQHQVVVTGLFGGTTNFDPGNTDTELTAEGGLDAYVAMLDSSGTFMWTKKIGGPSNDIGYDVAVDKQGNVYSTGFFEGTCEFDFDGTSNTLVTEGGRDIYVVKHDNNGDFAWVKHYGGALEGRGQGISVDEDGGVYTTGFFIDAFNFDLDNTDHMHVGNGRDYFIAKHNSTNGSIEWMHPFGSAGQDWAYRVKANNIGDVYVSGFFGGTIDFDPGSGTNNITADSRDGFVHILDSTGVLIDALIFNDNGNTEILGVNVDKEWNVYGVGFFDNTAQFDEVGGTASFTSSSGNDGVTIKFDGNCTAPDAPTLTETSNDICPNTTTTIDVTGGNLNDASDWVWYTDSLFTDSVFAGISYSTPSLTDTTTFYVRGEGACVVGTSKVTINVADNIAPTVVAADFTIGTDTGVCEATSVDFGETITDNCAISTTINDAPSALPVGTTTVTWTVTDESGNETIHAQQVTVEDQEAPVADMGTLGDIVELCEVTSLTPPTATDNCDGNIMGTHDATLPITITSTITWTYEDSNGNTSTQQQEVVIQNVDVSTSVDGIELTANNSTVGVDYRWIDCNNNNEPIINATNQVYVPEQNGSYAVIVLQDGCQDTSVCIDVTTVGLEDYTKKSNITVYPNPSADEFNIELASADAVNYTVTDNAGRIVSEGTFEQLVNTIDLSAEEQGVYFLRVDEKVIKLIRQ